jgi:hypothetical protein
MNSDENKREKICVENIWNKWNDQIKRLINIHEVIFAPQTLTPMPIQTRQSEKYEY